MHIHIDQLTGTELELAFEEQPQAFPVLVNMIKKGECGFPVSIRARLRTFRVGDMIEVEGRFETAVVLVCSRCLAEFETQLRSRFALTYTPEHSDREDDLSRDEVELSPEDAGMITFNGDRIDLREGIQEQIVMALPLRPLCRESCKGLCPQCGADQNKGGCNCDHSPSSSQFSVLKKLKL
jgi:uncharacterized protein